MSYFLSQQPLSAGEITELTGDEAKHILLSRRIEVGEIIEIQDLNNKRFRTEVVKIDKRSLSVQSLGEIPVPEESPLQITIFQALIKEQPLDFIIQKVTELGVNKLVLFNSKNSVERFKDMEKKMTRWRKIGEEAAKQSGRVQAVSIEYIADSKDINKLPGELDYLFLLEPDSKTKFSTWPLRSQVGSLGILIGPEGGFTEKEIEEFTKIKNIKLINLGPRILRADTAAIISSAIIQTLWGDM